jgi:hypothetical protein
VPLVREEIDACVASTTMTAEGVTGEMRIV